MIYVKCLFVLLILIPVMILMWHLIGRLISEFSESVKKSREEEKARAQALMQEQQAAKAREARYRAAYAHWNAGNEAIDGRDGDAAHEDKPEDRARNGSGVRHMMDKRRRRKERKKKKEQEQ